MIITIDGPAASGKSCAARYLAEKLGYYYLYSGMLYRACAYILLKHGGYSKAQFAHIKAGVVSGLFNVQRIRYLYTVRDGEKVFFDEVEITPHLKTPVIDEASSLLGINKAIRNAVSLVQHAIGTHENIVADGRDMGTAIFPHAEIKFFLTASVEERARRWQASQEKCGRLFTVQEAQAILTERDQRDTIREHAPLAVAPDAIMIDNTYLSAEETCEQMEIVVKKHIKELHELRQ